MAMVIKSNKLRERFDASKIRNSCFSAFLAGQMSESESRKLCSLVNKELLKWIDGKKEVSSKELFMQVSAIIRKYNKEAAYMYKTHRDIS